ncbi:hypothetical protein TURU_105321 [Turdus rufiventris]|nr:hypothetical protein TURU_105321 [Turdus rufiventris]
MLWNLANLGPSQYTTFIATINADTNQETVGSVANKLRNFESMINGPMQAHVSAVVKELKEEFKEKMREIREEELSLLEAEVSLTGKGWQKHPIVTGPETPRILGINFLQSGYYKDPREYRWAFGIAAVVVEGINQLNTLPGLSENPSAVGLLKVEEQRVPIATSTVHRRQYWMNRDAMIPTHKMIRELETQGVVSKTHSPFNSPIWPMCKSDGEWTLTVDYCALNEVTPPLSAAVLNMLELQYELESKASKVVCHH